MEEKKKQRQIKINMDKVTIQHASQFSIQTTSEDLAVDIGSGIFPGKSGDFVLPIHTRLMMTYQAAKRLSQLLTKALTEYEQEFGVIQSGPPVKHSTNVSMVAEFPKINFQDGNNGHTRA